MITKKDWFEVTKAVTIWKSGVIKHSRKWTRDSRMQARLRVWLLFYNWMARLVYTYKGIHERGDYLFSRILLKTTLNKLTIRYCKAATIPVEVFTDSEYICRFLESTKTNLKHPSSDRFLLFFAHSFRPKKAYYFLWLLFTYGGLAPFNWGTLMTTHFCSMNPPKHDTLLFWISCYRIMTNTVRTLIYYDFVQSVRMDMRGVDAA